MSQNSLSAELTITNTTDLTLTKTYQDSYQMTSWSFP